MYKIINCKIIGKTFDNSLALLICTDLKNYTHTCAHRKDKHWKTIGQKIWTSKSNMSNKCMRI